MDIVIRNGTVVDGTGAPARRADVGIADGRIVAIGDLADRDAGQFIDATGRVVCPGFVDVHTHYDAQVFWDNSLTPSSLHGVTSVFAGNCGFTVAPLSGDADDTDYLLKMLARVEGMPVESLQIGVPWTWRSTGEYLEAVEAGGLGINIGLSVGHSTIRRVVMGPAALEREATDDEIDAMCRILRESLEAGAIGFSSSRARSHNGADGRPVPSRFAHANELVTLAREVRAFEGTSLEIVPYVGPVFPDEVVDLLVNMSLAAQRPINWNVLRVDAKNTDIGYGKLAASDHARERGGKIVALAASMTPDRRVSFASGFGLEAIVGWEDVIFRSIPEKLALLSDPVSRARMNEVAQRQDNPGRGFADWPNHFIFDVVAPQNEEFRGRWLHEIAEERARDAWDVLCDIAVADGLMTSFGKTAGNETDDDWAARLQVWRDERVVIGASDAGAHLDQIAAFMYPTDLLRRAVRERGLLTIEEAIHLLTQVPAQLYGLHERGALAEGWWADIVVFDPAAIGPTPLQLRLDLPGSNPRLYSEAMGIDWCLVNGTATVDHGVATAARPGRLLRAGRDTATPSMD